MKGSLQWPIGASAGPLRVLSYTLTHKHELITADKWNKCKYSAAFLISNKSFHQTIGNKCRVWHQPVLHCNKTNAHTHTGHKSFRQMLNTSVFTVAVRSISHRAEQCGLNPSGLIPHTQIRAGPQNSMVCLNALQWPRSQVFKYAVQMIKIIIYFTFVALKDEKKNYISKGWNSKFEM